LARTVLLADDSVTAQNMGRRILMDAGYEVITVNNGSAALKKIHENQPDLIVLDVYMPGYGGLEVCQRLKESGETMRIPVLLTVGKMEPFKSEEARRVRADGHIVKPFDASELLAALTKLEDRIVPQADWARERKGKTEKKGKLWPHDDSAQPSAEWNEKIAYLAEVKQRQIEAELKKGQDVENSGEPAIHGERVAPPAEDLREGEAQQFEEVVPAAPVAPVVEAASAVPVQEFVAPETSRSEDEPAQPAANLALGEERAEASPASPPASSETAQETLVAVPDASVLPESPAASVEYVPQAAPEQARPLVVQRSRWIAENVALSAEEASLELEREMQQAQQSVISAQAESPADGKGSSPESAEDRISPQPQAGSAPDSGRSDDSHSGAVFAAAATASAGETAIAVPLAAAESEPEPAVASETRAAWENWQRIRDSVMSTQSAAAVVDAASEAAARKRLSQEASEEAEPSAAPVLDNAVLASIVDSVLAELKPKLMEEIAKKLKSK
jgi:CheY-like chemotaxis protein